jgi:anti-sigma factor RsiW
VKGLLHPITDGDLNAYVDGEISPERRDEVEVYLIAEPAQAARIETWRRQNEIIRAAFAKVASEPLPLSHTLALAHPPATRPQPAPRRAAAPHAVEEPIRDVDHAGVSRSEQHSRIAGVTVAAFAAGALVTMVAAELSGMTNGLLSEPSAAVATPVLGAPPPLDAGKLVASRAIEAYHTYAQDIIRPVEIEASQQPFLTNWLSRRVGFTIEVPDLSGEGLKLLGGRLTPGERGPAAFLLYETNGGDRIGLFIARAATDVTLRLRYIEERPASAVYWLDGGAAYALVGPAGRDRLMRIARRIVEELEPGTVR